MKKNRERLIIFVIIFFSMSFFFINNNDKSWKDYSNRAFIVAKDENGALISWRALKEDNEKTIFKLYKNNQLLKSFHAKDPTDFFDSNYTKEDNYLLIIIEDNKILNSIEPILIFQNSNHQGSGAYFDISLDVPKPFIMSNKEIAYYTPNDVVAYDVDGDGIYEFIVKWDPSNSKDNSIVGKTGNVYIDCYKITGKRLWRIDMGMNIRAGASYTQLLVYDYDGDNKAEMILKTADGTTDNFGRVIGNKLIDNRNKDGFIIKGNEYLTLFDGANGKILDTIDYYPKRENVGDWGDQNGNRADRFLAATAYLDGEHPSAITIRGIYTRIVAVSYNVVNKKLKQEWVFDTKNNKDKSLEGNANHQVMPADVDGDGRDELVLGSLVLDDDGTIYANANFGHGDALHVGDFDIENQGLEIFMCHEKEDYGISLRDGKTGKILFRNVGSEDTGRCLIDNLINNNTSELIGSHNQLVFNNKGEVVSDWSLENGEWNKNDGYGINFLVYWDGTLERELMDGVEIKKYREEPLFIGDGVNSINGTKRNPSLSADLFGDYREEVIFPTKDNKRLRVFTTTIYSPYRVENLMQNRQYHLQTTLQNIGYNQPPHLDYFLYQQ